MTDKSTPVQHEDLSLMNGFLLRRPIDVLTVKTCDVKNVKNSSNQKKHLQRVILHDD